MGGREVAHIGVKGSVIFAPSSFVELGSLLRIRNGTPAANCLVRYAMLCLCLSLSSSGEGDLIKMHRLIDNFSLSTGCAQMSARCAAVLLVPSCSFRHRIYLWWTLFESPFPLSALAPQYVPHASRRGLVVHPSHL